jgi:hypothetical protein
MAKWMGWMFLIYSRQHWPMTPSKQFLRLQPCAAWTCGSWMFKMLTANFRIKNLGTPSEVIGRNITVNDHGIFLNQEMFFTRVLKRYQHDQASALSVSMSTCYPVYPREDAKEVLPLMEYQSLMGSLQYLASSVRLDVTYAMNRLSRYCHKPVRRHWVAATKTLKNFNGYKTSGLYFKKEKIEKNICTLTAISRPNRGGPELNALSSDLKKSPNC